MRINRTFLAVFALVVFSSTLRAQITLSSSADQVELDRGLVIGSVAEMGRRPINTDAVVAGLVDGSLDPSKIKSGEELAPGHAWSDISASSDGFGVSVRNAYVLCRVRADKPCVMLLTAVGDAMVYVNGEPRAGDPYGHGYLTLPVFMRAGENTFLFAHAGRGPMRASLSRPTGDAMILDKDLTLPDARTDEETTAPLGVPIANTSDRSRTLHVSADAGAGSTRSDEFTILPGGVIKVCLVARVPASTLPRTLTLTLREGDHELASHEVKLAAPAPGAPYKITYTSEIDGSAQYASVLHGAGALGDTKTKSLGLVLSLHGASVEATNQAASYAAHPGYVIVCPTNRRPFGFDWEDWGRIDAMEALTLAQGRFHTDPVRTYLTGHSMGGHGTWNIGVLYPGRFAAIAPSAGWLSFDSYVSAAGPRFAPDGPLGDVFRRSRASCDSLAHFANLRSKGVYILHGDKDDNVPVEQARTARAKLEELHIPFGYHEEPGAGHWWDNDGPGAACVDWPGIWEVFDTHALEGEIAPPEVTPPIDERGFARGSFKRAFDHSFVLVYSTAGKAEENEWSMAKARFDAEQWWYRGNGRAVIESDEQFLARPSEGNVILYGNSDTNRAWKSLVGEYALLRLTGGRCAMDAREVVGPDVGVLAVLPRQGVPDRSVGIIGGTGLSGMRALDRMPYFSAGTGFADVTIVRARTWKDGFEGVEAAGGPGEMVWRERK